MLFSWKMLKKPTKKCKKQVPQIETPDHLIMHHEIISHPTERCKLQ